ncbi:hypothetical protein L7F22_066830 [Adiantum nelumboides]|nr:hypothetical protein [Adiantum nelumboides]
MLGSSGEARTLGYDGRALGSRNRVDSIRRPPSPFGIASSSSEPGATSTTDLSLQQTAKGSDRERAGSWSWRTSHALWLPRPARGDERTTVEQIRINTTKRYGGTEDNASSIGWRRKGAAMVAEGVPLPVLQARRAGQRPESVCIQDRVPENTERAVQAQQPELDRQEGQRSHRSEEDQSWLGPASATMTRATAS